MKLTKDFYQQDDVVTIAQELLGKCLVTPFGRGFTSGRIVETEAYSWKERGCHAFGGKLTPRNEVMFEAGGLAYVYVCYGIHHLFNVVTNKKGVADAVLVRAVEPVQGLSIMQDRRGILRNPFQLTSGPGKLSVALGIDRAMNGCELWKNQVWIEDDGVRFSSREIEVSKRIGIDYAGPDANLPWRFTVRENRWVSK
jgi:DNA-3-methyladenine glycosylase